MEVANANGWNEVRTLIHLRESIKEYARDCGRSATLDGVVARLRGRFGMTPREARAKLGTLRKASKTTL